jgi:hypothetical protein
MSEAEARARAAHAWYCDLMRMRFDFRFCDRLWDGALQEHDARAIARAARYVKKQVEEGGWDKNAAVPTRFLQADRLADYVGVSAPAREFVLTEEERDLAAEFRDLIGETVAAAARGPQAPLDWKRLVLERYPRARVTTWEALPPDIKTALCAPERLALPESA